MTQLTIDRSAFLETQPFELTAEISELSHEGHLGTERRLPASIVVPGYGNGMPFRVTKIERREGDLMSVRYRQDLGCVAITIFND